MPTTCLHPQTGAFQIGKMNTCAELKTSLNQSPLLSEANQDKSASTGVWRNREVSDKERAALTINTHSITLERFLAAICSTQWRESMIMCPAILMNMRLYTFLLDQ